MSEELKPCERCGSSDWIYSQPQFFRVVEEGSNPIGWAVVCKKCGIKVEGYFKDETEAIWQTRPLEAALQARVDELQAKADRLTEEMHRIIGYMEIEAANSKLRIGEAMILSTARRALREATNDQAP